MKQLADACGFELAGIAQALPLADFSRFEAWRSAGHAAEMRYLTDRRGDVRGDPRNLLPTAQSIVCVGKLYNLGTSPADRSPADTSPADQPACGRISRYAGECDYHDVLREALTALANRIEGVHGEPMEWRACVDTAPLLERSYAHAAGLGWIGKNTCLINQQQGSWFFLGELLLSISLPPDVPPPDRCGTCTRCIDACPTAALVPNSVGGWTLDSRKCISYLTIEKRGAPNETDANTGSHLFGCDICQEVCPWNREAAVTEDQRFRPVNIPPELESLAALSENDFRAAFRHSPVWRARYEGFLRNVASAIGNSGDSSLCHLLDTLAAHPNPVVSAAARLAQLRLCNDASISAKM